MFKFLKKKSSPKQRSRVLDYFQVNHPVDLTYKDDINGVAIKDAKAQKELERLTDLAIAGTAPAELQAIMLPESKDPHNMVELGYVFGCLDIFKCNFWGVKDFNRSFFHYGFLIYFGSFEAKDAALAVADSALMAAGAAITDKNSEFFRAVEIGRDDAIHYAETRSPPSGLINLLSS